jgi:polyisoprenoid-binding protein YceI
MTGYSRTAFRAGSFLTMVLCTWAAWSAGAPPEKYTLDPSRSLLRFSFVQAKATNTGRFGKFNGTLAFSNDNPSASKIDLTIEVGSLNTGDDERDTTLKGADLFDVAKFPQARYVGTKFVPTGASRFEAQGKLTIRNVTKDLKVPLTVQRVTEQGKSVAYLKGAVTIRRLDFGVGQGEWKSTEWVDDNVTVSFSLRFVPAT